MEKKYFGIYNSNEEITHCIDTKNWIILDIINSKILKLDNQNVQDVFFILLNTNREVSITEISDKLGYSDRTIRRTLDKLSNILGKEVLPSIKGKSKKLHERCNSIDMKKYAFYYEKIEKMKNIQEYQNELIDIINREEYSYQMDQLLETYHLCGILGGPGSGKTTLAFKYAQNKKYKYKQYKFDCANLNSFTNSLGLNTSLDNCLNIEDRIYSTLCNLIFSDKEERKLFIFDNISYDDGIDNIKNIETMIQELINKINSNYSQYVDIIYTARFEKRRICEITIEDFNEKEAYEFLTNNIKFEYKEETIKNIIQRNKLPIYLNTIKTLAIEENNYERINDDYSKIPPSNLKIIIEDIFKKYNQTKSGKHLIDLLKISSMCSNEVDIEYIKCVCEKLELGSQNIINIKKEFDRKCSLLKFNEEKNTLLIHRTYQDVIRTDLMSQNERTRIMNAMIDVLSEKIKYNHYFSSQQIEKYINIIDHLYEKYMINEKTLMDHLPFLELISYAIHYYGTYYGPKNVYYINYSNVMNGMSCVGNQFKHKLFIKLLTKFNVLMIQGVHEIERNQMLDELNTYESIIDHNFTKEYLYILKIRYLYAKATILRLSNKNNEAIACFKEGLEISKEINSPETLIYVHQHNAMNCVYIGDIYRRNRNFNKAQEYYQDALNYTKSNSISELFIGESYHLEMYYCIGFIYNNYGMSLLEQNTSIDCLHEGFEYLEKSIKIYMDLKLYKSISLEMSNLSLYYEKYAIQIKGDSTKTIEFERNLHYAKAYLECSLLILNKYLNYISSLEYVAYYQHCYLILYLWAAHLEPIKIDKNISILLLKELNNILSEEEINELTNSNFDLFVDHQYVFHLMEEGRKYLYEALRHNLKVKNIDFDYSSNILINNSYSPTNTVLLTRYMGISYRRQAECCDNKEDYQLAISYFEKAIEMANKLKNNGQKAFAYREMLIVYMKTDLNKFMELLKNEDVNQTFNQLSSNDELYKWFSTLKDCK